MATNTKSTTASSSTKPRRLLNARLFQNFHLVWLDESIDETKDDCRNSITKLQQVVNTVNTFIDYDECIDFITDIEEKVFMVVSGQFSQTIISIVQDISQVNCVYIFRESNMPYEKLAKEWPKVAGVYADITSICEALKQAAHDCDHNSVSISFAKKPDGTANQSLDTLDPSFMYTQILKEIFLTIDFEEVHFNEFITYCREQFVDSSTEMKNIDMIEKEYHRHQPIWWYTYPCFLYSMLNRALRLMEADLIVNMGFFVRNLHEHITALHFEQYGGQNRSNSFTVYRGQGFSQTDFNHMKTTHGGLISFNNFLSTSLDREVSFAFAESTTGKPDLIGILFEMKIDPSLSSTSFANVANIGYFQGEEEILFSMHSVFRIGQVKQIDEKNNRLWQVELTLTDDHDPQLQELTKSMRDFTEGPTGWFRLGRLMMKVAQVDKAQQVFEMILNRTTREKEKGEIYHYLGWIKYDQGKYTEAITYCEKSLKIFEKTLPSNHPDLNSCYNTIGSVYVNMGEYSKALSYYEKVLETKEKTLPTNHPDLATYYNNIGLVYKNMGEYSKALSYYDKALEIEEKTLPSNHPSWATSYNNIGLVYKNMGEYSKALSYYEKALEIFEKTLPPNHPDLASSYNNIGNVCREIGEYSKALSYYERALEIYQKTLPANHPSLATSYNNIGAVYSNVGEYSKALSYYKKALEIRQKTLLANHPDFAQSYNNIGEVYREMGEYSKAFSYYEKAREIFEKTLPANHPSLATSYNNIGLAYQNMGEYSKALSYCEKGLEIKEKTLPANHPSLATSYSSIGSVYSNMGQYSKALSYCEKALEICQKILPANHPDLATCYNSIGSVYNGMGEYSKALSSHEKGLEIEEKSLSANHPNLARSYNNIGGVYQNMGEYSKALSYCEKTLEICQKTLPANHPDLATYYKNICAVYVKMGQYSKAVPYYEKSLLMQSLRD
jgi:tetratricopeptide (TPR) repeat protein